MKERRKEKSQKKKEKKVWKWWEEADSKDGNIKEGGENYEEGVDKEEGSAFEID